MKLSEKSTITLGITIIIIGAVISCVLAFASVKAKADENAWQIEQTRARVEKNHEETIKLINGLKNKLETTNGNLNTTNGNLIKVNTKLEDLLR